MELDRSVLDQAVQRGIVSEQQGRALWQFLEDQAQNQPRFRVTHVLYYLGGLIAIGAMSLFMTLGWESFGGWGLFAIALAYAVAALWLTEYLLHVRQLPLPAGVTAAFAVTLTPLAVYGVQVAAGWWPEGQVYREFHTHIDWRWIIMELATLAAGAVLLWRYRLPFLVMPVAVVLWYMSMDLTPFLFSDPDEAWERRKLVSVAFGAAMLSLAFWVDLRAGRHKDYAFWLYLFGTAAFWGGLSMMESSSEFGRFLYFCINLLMIAAAALLSRRVLAVFGGLGAAGYLGYLAHEVFAESVLFPFTLTFIGLGVIGLGVIWLGIVWQRKEAAINAWLVGQLPRGMAELVQRGR